MASPLVITALGPHQTSRRCQEQAVKHYWAFCLSHVSRLEINEDRLLKDILHQREIKNNIRMVIQIAIASALAYFGIATNRSPTATMSRPLISISGLSGYRVMPGRSRNAARIPAMVAPATSQPWVAMSVQLPIGVPTSFAAQ